MKPKNYQPSDAELDILQVLWKGEPMTVRQVHEALSRRKEVGYTTTLKQMQRLLKKDVLTREERGNTHLYSTKVEEKAVRRSLFRKLLDTAFRGSASELMLHALGEADLSEAEIADLERLIAEKKKESDA